MDILNVGVIGAGGIANNIHLPVLAGLENVRLCAVCDLVRERAEVTASTFGIEKSYVSYHDMLALGNIDAVFVLTEPDALFRAAKAALEAGKHVFMEKPMGINLLQARTLRDLATAQGVTLHVGYNRRFIPLVREVVKVMQGLTNITHVEGRFYKDSSPDFYGGCASAFTCDVVHVIDLIRHLAGCPAESAVTMETTDGDSAHAWYSLIRFKNGISGVVRSNYRTGGRVHEFELHGLGASAYINLGFGDAEISARILRGAGGYSLSAANTSNPDIIEFDGVKLGGVGYERYYGYYDEDRNFVESTLGLVSPESTTERLREDYETMELVQLLLDSRI